MSLLFDLLNCFQASSILGDIKVQKSDFLLSFWHIFRKKKRKEKCRYHGNEIANKETWCHLFGLLSTPMGVDYIIIGFDISYPQRSLTFML